MAQQQQQRMQQRLFEDLLDSDVKVHKTKLKTVRMRPKTDPHMIESLARDRLGG